MKKIACFLLVLSIIQSLFQSGAFALEPTGEVLCCVALRDRKPLPSFCSAQQLNCTETLSRWNQVVMSDYYGSWLNVSEKFQPNYDHPQQYSLRAMEQMARETLYKLGKELGVSFNRKDPQHILRLAEFFHLTSEERLDLFSTPMEEADVRYFSEVEAHKNDEFFPITASDLAIRFYWEGLARLLAADFQLEIVNERRARNPQKTRGKVSDMATTAMFDKKPGMSIEQARQQGRERYDLGRLIEHLRLKGLSGKY